MIVPRSIRCLLCILALALCSQAQAQTALDIVVLAPDGAPAAGIEVEIANPETGFARRLITDAQGRIFLDGLNTAGAYVVRADGAESPPQRLRANAARRIVLSLGTAAGIEEIAVTARRQFLSINATDAEVSSSLSEVEIDSLPIEGRDLIRGLIRLPNVVPSTGFFPEAPPVSINGANALFAQYLIDGLDNNESFLGGQLFAIPTGAAQAVTVLASNYSAEYGRTGNGVVNVTTKSGGNDYAGEVFFLTRPGDDFDADSPFPTRDLSGNQVSEGFKRYQGGASLGGPIIRDRTFFFGSVEVTRDEKDNVLSSPQLGIAETVPGENSFLYATGRIDHRFNDRLEGTLRAHLGQVEIERQGGGLEGGVTFPSAGSTQTRDSAILAASATWTGADWSWSGAVQTTRFDWDYAEAAQTGPQVTVLAPNGDTAAVIGHPGFVFDLEEVNWQTKHRLTTELGDHALSVGVDWLRSDFALAGGGNPDGNYTVRLSQGELAALRALDRGAALAPSDIPAGVDVIGYGVEIRPATFGTEQDLVGLWIEDRWTPRSDLTVTLGLRWDYDSLSKGGSDAADLDNVSPRVAVNWQPDPRQALRFGAGIFTEKVPYAVYSDALQQNSTAPGFRDQLQSLIDLGILPSDTDLDRVTFDGNLTVNPEGVAYLQGPGPQQAEALRATAFSNERRILNPRGYDNPFTVQLSAGYQRQLTDSMIAYADLIYARGYNLVRLRDLNAPAPFRIDPAALDGITPEQAAALVRSQEEADATRPVAPVPGGARGIVVSETEGESEYRALNLTLAKERGPDDYAFRLAYTLSRLENDTDDINFRAEDANDFSREWAVSANDRTHVISATGTWYTPLEGLSLTAAVLAQSGQPINRVPDAALFGTRDLNGDGRSFADSFTGNSDRFPGAGRNSDRLPWSYTVDLSVQYDIALARGALELRADIFNLFNENNLSGFANNATQSNQIQIGGTDAIVQRNAAPPRQVQFGVRWVF